MLEKLDILLVGVGGQGTILASKILVNAAAAAGYDIKMSEIHGMAQRGGSVVTHVRLGSAVSSPMVEEGRTDVILAFEQLEGLRWLGYLKPGGSLILSTQVIYSVPVLAGLAAYPEDISGYIAARVPDALVIDALQAALQCGNAKAANVVLVGALAARLPLERALWEQALRETVPPRLLEVNLAAFAAGYEYRKG